MPGMTVKELKDMIADLPDDMAVILQKDAEGNGYSPLYGADPDCHYVPDTSYSGTVYARKYTAEDNCMSETAWKRIKRGPRCLVLYPRN